MSEHLEPHQFTEEHERLQRRLAFEILFTLVDLDELEEDAAIAVMGELGAQAVEGQQE